MSTTPAIFRLIEGKVPHEVFQAFRLLFNGQKDTHDAIVSLKGQHDTLSTTVATTTQTANAAATQAAAANETIAAPVPAGQVNYQSAAYAVQQQDHLGSVVLQGTSALAITLNNLVTAPYTTHLINQSTQTATLTPLTGTVNGTSSFSLVANANVHAYFDGQNWIVA